MHSLLYLVVVLLVAGFFVSLPIYPFWKVQKRLREHHPDIWAARGPFDFHRLRSDQKVFKSFLEIVSVAERDALLKERDPELIRWTRLAREVWRMTPSGTGGWIGYFILLAFLVIFFSSIIMKIFS